MSTNHQPPFTTQRSGAGEQQATAGLPRRPDRRTRPTHPTAGVPVARGVTHS
ncbi:MAG: hypothetical protein IT429_13735 [Gemmataceae bacterium]|nr:hypothetical protein [Gemmataceae bacterium]